LKIGKISPIDYSCNLRNTNLKIFSMIINRKNFFFNLNMNIYPVSWLILLILKKVTDIFTITITLIQ